MLVSFAATLQPLLSEIKRSLVDLSRCPTLGAEVATQAPTPEPNDLVAVLDHVRANGESSRAELAQATVSAAPS